MFARARDLFDRYSAELLSVGRSSDLSFEREYLIEAKQRLEQLDFIVGRVQALAKRTAASNAWARNQYASKMRSIPPGAMSLSEQQGLLDYLEEVAPPFINDVEIRVLAEAFYYNAWRTFQVLRKLPGMRTKTWTGYAAMPRRRRCWAGLRKRSELLIRTSLYQRM